LIQKVFKRKKITSEANDDYIVVGGLKFETLGFADIKSSFVVEGHITVFS
jgi:hypothetical protein